MTLSRNLILIALCTAALIASACQPPETPDDCDPTQDDCVCTYEDGQACEDPGDLDCACTIIDPQGIDPSTEVDPEDTDPEEQSLSFRYVLVEDLTDPIGGDAPGADIDAIAVVKNDAAFYATAIEDSNLGGNSNAFLDPGQLLGAPDAGCEKKNFTSLGGARAGGYVIVSFATPQRDVTIDNGDTIEVFELGRTLCPNTRYDDDPYRVSVSVSDELGTFQEIGIGGEGQNSVTVTGLQ